MMELPEHTVDNLIRALVRKYPNRKNISIGSVEEIIGGWETRIFSVAVMYELENDIARDDLILRLFQGPSSGMQAEKESDVMRRVARFGIPVPSIELLVTPEPGSENAFVAMEKIRGSTLTSLLEKASLREKERLVRLMVAPFVRLHQIPWRAVVDNGNHDQSADGRGLGSVKSMLAKMKHLMDRYELYEFELFVLWLEDRLELGASARLSVLHNDYHPGNILTREGSGELVIIDWSFADVGDYRLDLAWLALQLSVTLGPHYRDTMLQAYEEMAGTVLEHLEYFEALKFTARMLTIVTWLDGAVEIPVMKITRQAIREEYKVHVLNVYERLREITGMQLRSIENL